MRDGDLHGFHYYECTYSPVAQQRTDIKLLVSGKEQRCWDRWHAWWPHKESATIIQAWFHRGVYYPSGEDQLAPVWTASVLQLLHGGQYHWQQHGCGVGLRSICSWGHGWRCHQLSLFFILSFYHYIIINYINAYIYTTKPHSTSHMHCNVHPRV